MSLRKDYKFKVKYVKFGEYNGSPMTKFSVYDKVKGGTRAQYWNITVWGEHLNLQDGDFVVVKEINEVGASEWNGKTYYNASCTVEVEQMETLSGEDIISSKPDYVPDFARSVENESKIVIKDDDDTDLPFDL